MNDAVEMTNRLSVLDGEGLREISSASSLLEHCFGDIETLEVPIDIKRIIDCVEGVRYSDSLGNFEDLLKSGFVRVERDQNRAVKSVLIWVNPTEMSQRQRFTAAHELGHLVHDVYPSIDDDTVDEEISDSLTLNRGAGRSYRETRADRFAAQLLMPSKLVEREVRNLLATVEGTGKKITKQEAIEVLSQKFDVSRLSMEIRLKTLGYIK